MRGRVVFLQIVQTLHLPLAGLTVCLGVDGRCCRACMSCLVLNKAKVVLDVVEAGRKSCIKNWAKVNRDPNVTRELAGHADLKTTMEYYNTVTKEDRAEAARGVEALVSEEKD